MVVEAAQEQVHRQAHPQFALRQQARGQRGNGHPIAATTAGVLRAHGLAHDQFGRHVFQFFAKFFADADLRPAALGARREVLRLQYRLLALQMLGQRMTATSPWFERFLRLVRLQNLVAERWLLLGFFLEVGRHFGQLAFLLGSELIGFFTKELPLQLGQFLQDAFQLRLQPFLERHHPEVLGLELGGLALQAFFFHFQRAVQRPQSF